MSATTSRTLDLVFHSAAKLALAGNNVANNDRESVYVKSSPMSAFEVAEAAELTQ
jgi:hypothetical protein